MTVTPENVADSSVDQEPSAIHPRWHSTVLMLDAVVGLCLSIGAMIYAVVGLSQHSAFHCAAAAMLGIFAQWRISPDELP